MLVLRDSRADRTHDLFLGLRPALGMAVEDVHTERRLWVRATALVAGGGRLLVEYLYPIMPSIGASERPERAALRSLFKLFIGQDPKIPDNLPIGAAHPVAPSSNPVAHTV